jgi:hypothetical protein
MENVIVRRVMLKKMEFVLTAYLLAKHVLELMNLTALYAKKITKK